jgi:hypothetical protein
VTEKRQGIIVDLDGTMADANNKRPFWDASRSDKDLARPDVKWFVNRILKSNLVEDQYDPVDIIFCSGREEKDRNPTARFLIEHTESRFGLSEHCRHLFMRATGDKRNDAIVKAEIYFRDIEPKWNVIMAIDDRDRVVQAWREVCKIPCWQVQPGAF